MRMLCLLFSLLCASNMTGCHTYHPVTLEVANTDGVPISGATAVASPMYFFNPTSESHLFIGAYDILEPFPAKSTRGVTDTHGLVTLEVVGDSPLQLHVYAEGFSPWSGHVAITKQERVELSQVDEQSELVVSARLTTN